VEEVFDIDVDRTSLPVLSSTTWSGSVGDYSSLAHAKRFAICCTSVFSDLSAYMVFDASKIVPILLVSLIPTVTLVIAGWILIRFRNFLVSTLVVLIALIVAAYGVVSLLIEAPQLHKSLQTGEIPLLITWSVIHFALLVVFALQIIRRAI